MKLVVAIINAHKLENVRAQLADSGVSGMTVTEVMGFGRQHGQKEIYRGAEYEANFLPKLKIEIIVEDDLVDKIAESVIEGAKAGQIGDGKIWVLDVEQAYRIRTGEMGPDAI